jgi:hypothetical protein
VTATDGRELLAAAQARVDAKRKPRVVAMRPADPQTGPTPDGDDLDDALATLLEDGAEVVVAFRDEARRHMYHRDVWLVRLQILDGEHAGRLISWWLRALDTRRGVARGSAIATAYVAATGLRPPRDLARRRPSYWLADAHYRVSTRVVAHDTRGQARPAAASYSVVAAILERVAGCSPALRERGR